MRARTYVIMNLILTVGLLNTTAVFAHTPSFSWRVKGDANYEQWIFDGEEPIAMFDAKSMDEPMQALMMFRAVPCPLLLRNLKLEPGGKPLISSVQLYWKSGTFITDKLDGLEIEGQGSEKLTVVFTTVDPWETIRVERTLTLTYDDELASYVYDFKDTATVLFPETFQKAPRTSFEICDPWYNDCPAPSQEFPGMWRGRYQQFAYENAEGGVTSIPHHHVSNPQKGNIHLKPDGVFAAIYEKDGNPAFQLMGETAENISIGICPWAYDVHFNYSVDSSVLNNPVHTHFRFFNCPADKVKMLQASAEIQVQETSRWGGLTEFPVYEPKSSFDKFMSINRIRMTDIDYWFWMPTGEEGAVVEKDQGRTGRTALKIAKESEGLTSWYSMCEGQGYWAQPWTPCKGYEVSCWVKTDKVSGEGSSIGICYHVPNVPPEWPIVQSRRLKGTNKWIKLTVTIGPPPEGTSIVSLYLNQSGRGATWFDDLEVKMIK